MSAINPVGGDASQVSYQQALASSQSVGVQTIKPETRQNETIDAAPEVEHAQSQHTDEQYSHVRYIARNAFMTGSGSGTASLASNAENGGYIAKAPETQVSGTEQTSGTSQPSGTEEASGTGTSETDDEGKTEKTGSSENGGSQLTEAEQEQVEELKDRDSEVRQHEQAHQSAGGQYAGSPSYDYQTGPDGNRYAIGGHVNIDVSEESTPEKTIQKMQQVIQAAHAPADPSGQDLRVASEAQQTMAQAQTEKMQESSQSSEEGGSQDESSDGSNAAQESGSATSAQEASGSQGTQGSPDTQKASESTADQASDSDGSSPSVAAQAPKKLSENTSITGNDSSATAGNTGAQL